MKFFKDLVQAEPVYRSLPLGYNVSFVDGGAVTLDTTAATISVIPYASATSNAFQANVGVYCGASLTTTGTIAAGTTQYGKILVNPFAIYLAEYERDTYVTTTNFSGTTWTATHEGCAGDWIMDITTTSAAYGRLLYIASTSTTTTMTTLSTPTTTPGTTDNWIHIRHNMAGHAGAQYDRINLDATGQDITSAATYSGKGMVILDNHVRSDRSTSLQPLRRVTHNNTQDSTYKVYGELKFTDTIWTTNADTLD